MTTDAILAAIGVFTLIGVPLGFVAWRLQRRIDASVARLEALPRPSRIVTETTVRIPVDALWPWP